MTNTPSTPKKKIRFITRDNHKLYVDPDTGEFIPGVTSIINNLPKPFLKDWGQKLVAEEAVAKQSQVANLSAVDPQAAIDWLKKAPNRFTAHSAKVGHEAHEVFEELALGNSVGNLDPEIQIFADHFKDYLDTLQPEFKLLEEGIWDPDYGYAGTFDAVAKYNNPDITFSIDGVEQDLVGIAWQDNKTTRSGVHAEVGLQLAAYRHAKYILRPDGSTVLNRPGDMALVLHVRPEGWELIPVRAGAYELKVFRTLATDVTDWVRKGSREVIAPRIMGNRKRRATRVSSKEA